MNHNSVTVQKKHHERIESSGRNRRERERAAHRAAILRAAEAVFAEQGFASATMEAIARRAEFSVGALYLFFPNKEALFGEVLRHLAEKFHDTFRETMEQKRPVLETVRAVIRLQIATIMEHAALFQAVLGAYPLARISPDSSIPSACVTLYDQYVSDLAGLFERAMKENAISRQDPRYVALTFQGILHAFNAYWRRQQMAPSLEERARLIEAHFLTPILRTPRRTSQR